MVRKANLATYTDMGYDLSTLVYCYNVLQELNNFSIHCARSSLNNNAGNSSVYMHIFMKQRLRVM